MKCQRARVLMVCSRAWKWCEGQTQLVILNTELNVVRRLTDDTWQVSAPLTWLYANWCIVSSDSENWKRKLQIGTQTHKNAHKHIGRVDKLKVSEARSTQIKLCPNMNNEKMRPGFSRPCLHAWLKYGKRSGTESISDITCSNQRKRRIFRMESIWKKDDRLNCGKMYGLGSDSIGKSSRGTPRPKADFVH